MNPLAARIFCFCEVMVHHTTRVGQRKTPCSLSWTSRESGEPCPLWTLRSGRLVFSQTSGGFSNKKGGFLVCLRWAGCVWKWNLPQIQQMVYRNWKTDDELGSISGAFENTQVLAPNLGASNMSLVEVHTVYPPTKTAEKTEDIMDY